MKKFCVALAISMIAYGNVEATDLKLGFSVTHIFNNNDPVLTPSDQRLAPEWTKEVEFTVNGSKYFVGVSNWMESESLALHSAKANALGAMAFAKQSTVSTWYEEQTSHSGESGNIQSSRRNTTDFRHAKSDVTLSGFKIQDIYTEYDKGMFKTKYKKYVLIKAAKEENISEGSPGQINYYKDVGKIWIEPHSGITFVPIPETDLWMSQTEITVGQFTKFINVDIPKVAKNTNYPVSYINFNQVTEFIDNFNLYTNYKARLPTEDEWVWACKAGRYNYASGNNEGYILKQTKNNAKLHNVKKYKPNKFNLYGMSSNAAEYILTDGATLSHNLKGGSKLLALDMVDCNYTITNNGDTWKNNHNSFRLVIE